MHDRDDAPQSAPPPDRRGEVDPDVAELLGLRPTDAEPVPDRDELESLDEMTENEVRVGETDDAITAAEEGLVWIPPMDPPTRPGEDGEPEIAAGFGTTADDEPYDLDHHSEPVPAEDERTARIVEALRADAQTSGLADSLSIDTDGGRVIVEGTVADIDDEDAVLAVIDEVAGVSEIVNRLVVISLAEAREPS